MLDQQPLIARPAAPARIVRRAAPEISEAPIDALNGELTPNALFYIRDHFPRPELDPAAWRLAVGGLTERPLSLSLDELRALPWRELAATLECAGNGGHGNRLRRGGVSTARWGGVSLGEVLWQAGPTPEAAHVILRGADSGIDPDTPTEAHEYERSLPIAKAFHPDTLLALEMNGEPLPPEHGGPLRLVVPGWYGMDAIKWLVDVRLAAEPSRHFFMTRRYREAYTTGEEVRAMAVKSLIARPSDGARLPLGPCTVEGIAWAGEATVVGVDVSTNDGASWQPAELVGDARPWAWRLWRFAWRPERAGEHTLRARARDRHGLVQPMAAPLGDRGHYRMNAVESARVVVTVSSPSL